MKMTSNTCVGILPISASPSNMHQTLNYDEYQKGNQFIFEQFFVMNSGDIMYFITKVGPGRRKRWSLTTHSHITGTTPHKL